MGQMTQFNLKVSKFGTIRFLEFTKAKIAWNYLHFIKRTASSKIYEIERDNVLTLERYVLRLCRSQLDLLGIFLITS